MRMVYWYTPFVDLEGDVLFMVKGGNVHQEKIGSEDAKKKTYISTNNRNPKLAGIGKGDRLYIIGHGDSANGMIVADAPGAIPTGYTNHLGKPGLTPDQLVAVMEADGCDWSVRDIRVYACKAARGTSNFVESFANLVKAKNAKATIYGYQSMLDRSTAPGRKLAMFDSGAAPDSRASKYRLSYGRQKTPPIEDTGPNWQDAGQNWNVNPIEVPNRK